MSQRKSRKAPTFDIDASALFAACTTQPSLNHKIIIDNTIRRLKAEGLWDKSTAIYGVMHSLTDSLLNWKTRVKATTADVTYYPFKGLSANRDGAYVNCSEVAFTNTAFWERLNAHAFMQQTQFLFNTPSSRIMSAQTGTANDGMVNMRFQNQAHVIQVNSAAPVATNVTTSNIGSIGAARNNENTVRKCVNGIPLGEDYAEPATATMAGYLTWAGSPGVADRNVIGWAQVGRYLTDTEMASLHNITKYYVDSVAQLV